MPTDAEMLGVGCRKEFIWWRVARTGWEAGSMVISLLVECLNIVGLKMAWWEDSTRRGRERRGESDDANALTGKGSLLIMQ